MIQWHQTTYNLQLYFQLKGRTVLFLLLKLHFYEAREFTCERYNQKSCSPKISDVAVGQVVLYKPV
jgi:hypothetical protein